MSGEGKLVRSRVPERGEARGAQPDFRAVIDAGEHVDLLCSKLLEEAGEAFLAALRVRTGEGGPEGVLEEVADTVEAGVALAFIYGFTVRDVVAAVRRKRASHGDLMAGTVLYWRDTCKPDK